jgi:hypothetical protein
MKLLPWIICLALAAFICWQQCSRPARLPEKKIERDTAWHRLPPIIVHDTPALTSSIKPVVIPKPPAPSRNYDSLLHQYIFLVTDYNNVLEEHLSINEYNDTARQDSSSVFVKTYVNANAVTAHDIQFNLRYPVITVKETTTLPPRRQLYFGGDVGLRYVVPGIEPELNAGLMYRNKRENFFGATIGISTTGYNLNIHSYHLISLRKNR